MGVKHLWQLESIICNRTELQMDWKTMHHSILAIDLSYWINESSTIMKYKCSKLYLRNLFYRIHHLISLGIKLIFICDGKPPTQKRLACNKPYNEEVKECKKLLNILGIPVIDLIYGEAEAYCSQLQKQGIVTAVLSPDSDCFLFGATKVLTGYKKIIKTINYYDINNTKLNQRTFIALALLLGTDYCDGIKGIGSKKAPKLLKNAMKEYGIMNNNKNNDALFHIEYWVQMNQKQILKKFESNLNRKQNIRLEKFILQIKETYINSQHLNKIVDAYLNPKFDKINTEKLLNSQCLKYESPNLQKMNIFTNKFFFVNNPIRDTLNITLNMYIHKFVTGNTYEISHITKIQSKNTIYTVQWKCNDKHINKQIFENKILNVKCKGLHSAYAININYPYLVKLFEVKYIYIFYFFQYY